MRFMGNIATETESMEQLLYNTPAMLANAWRFDGFLKRHRRHDREYELCQYRFAGAGCADKQNIEPAGAG
jgi:hypothetical protein